MTTALPERVVINTLAGVLRDQADRDYICARHLYSLGFCDQFMWQSQQALEKYFKATLLFAPARPPRKLWGWEGYGHDLIALLDDFLSILPWRPELPVETKEFVGHVHKMGSNRYADKSVYRFGDELPKLDCAVWHVRAWCQYNDPSPPRFAVNIGEQAWVDSHRLRVLSMPRSGSQHISGHLEQMIAGHHGELTRDARAAILRWNSWYFIDAPSVEAPPRWSGSSTGIKDRDWAQDLATKAILRSL